MPLRSRLLVALIALVVLAAHLLEVAARHLAGRRRQALPVDRRRGFLGRPADLLHHLLLLQALEAALRPVAHDLQPALVRVGGTELLILVPLALLRQRALPRRLALPAGGPAQRLL